MIRGQDSLFSFSSKWRLARLNHTPLEDASH